MNNIARCTVPLCVRRHCAYIERAGLPAMAINGRRNKPIGPGGSTRRLHHSGINSRSHTGAKQDRRGRKGRCFCSAWFRRYRANLIVANDNYAPVAQAA